MKFNFTPTDSLDINSNTTHNFLPIQMEEAESDLF